MTEGTLTATQYHHCALCNLHEETSQTAQVHFAEGAEQPRFSVVLPQGWQTVNGKTTCSVECARALLEEA